MLVAFIKPFTSRRKVSIWPELELRKDNSQFWFLRLVIYNYTIELRFFKRVTICNSQLALNFRFHKSLTCARQIFMGSREGIVSTWWCLETSSTRISNFEKKIFLMEILSVCGRWEWEMSKKLTGRLSSCYRRRTLVTLSLEAFPILILARDKPLWCLKKSLLWKVCHCC